MNEMQVFNNPQFGNLRTIQRDGEPWFFTKDISDILKLGNPRSTVALLDSDEKGVHIMDTPGGPQENSIVSEPGMYSMIIKSRRPEAKAFRRWITHEVIPAIRKTGGYIAGDNLTDAEIMARAMVVAQDTLKRREERIKALESDNAALMGQIEADAPKVLFADCVEASKQTILVGELAKLLRQNGLDIGQNRLYARLRDEGYLGKKGDFYNVPTQRAMDMGLFEIKESTVTTADGTILIKKTARITGKGQTYFVKRYLGSSAAQKGVI